MSTIEWLLLVWAVGATGVAVLCGIVGSVRKAGEADWKQAYQALQERFARVDGQNHRRGVALCKAEREIGAALGAIEEAREQS